MFVLCFMLPDDSIFDLSQASPQTSPGHVRRPAGSPVVTAAAGRTRSPATRSHHPAPPIPPIDPFEFQLSEEQAAVAPLDSTPPPSRARARRSSTADAAPAPLAPPPIPAPAAAAATGASPMRGGQLPMRRAALARKSYRELETQADEDEEMRLSSRHASSDEESQPESSRVATSREPRTPSARGKARDAPSSTASTSASASNRKKRYPARDLHPDACAVCGEVTEEEAVVRCVQCGVQVHSELCYGPPTKSLSAEERANWHCDRCSPRMGKKDVECCVCPNTDDQAFKKTDHGKWIHASCASWSQGKHIERRRVSPALFISRPLTLHGFFFLLFFSPLVQFRRLAFAIPLCVIWL